MQLFKLKNINLGNSEHFLPYVLLDVTQNMLKYINIRLETKLLFLHLFLSVNCNGYVVGGKNF